MSYDAWGNRRDPKGWSVYAAAPTGLITDRGFTGHEHIDLFDLVNMDGRVYDPVIGRFLSADPVIQDPENLQSLNRYAYCINNPLSLTDPSGYSWLSDNWRSLVAAGIAIGAAALTAVTMGGASPLLISVIAGGVGGFSGGFSGTLLNGGNLLQAYTAGIIGGAIGAATGFLSYAAGGIEAGISKTAAVFERAAKHAFADAWMGGVKSAVYGGEWSPIRDMIGGSLSSAGNGVINENVNGLTLKMASSAILGGTISEIGGGKFANGAITGAYSMLFNELSHPDDDKNQVLAKKTNTIVDQPNLEFDLYTTGIDQTGDPAYTEVIDLRSREPIEVRTKIGTIGTDGSVTVGGILQVGTDGKNYILDVSIPTGTGTTGGFTIKLNSQMVNKMILFVAPFILRTPYRIPVYG